MRNSILKQAALSVMALLLFVLTFFALQHKNIYYATLARLGYSYEKVHAGKETWIGETKKPYVQLSNESVKHWDAALYLKIRNTGYTASDRLAKEKLAFYPLFPLVWSLSTIDSEYIVFFCYGLFICGLILLSLALTDAGPGRLFVYCIGLLLPTAVNFYLPYAESLFLLCMALAVYGIYKGNYPLYFLGTFLFCLCRPSALIFMAALFSADLIYLLSHRRVEVFVKRFAKKITPCIVGFLVVTFSQYRYSGSWTAYFDSMEIWPAESGLFNPIRDWSVEGFGMSVFSIFFLAAPALIYVCAWAWTSFRGKRQDPDTDIFESDVVLKKNYLFHVSLLFIAGNLVYTFLTSGNMLNGFSRYTMAVPFFYILLFQLPEKIRSIPIQKRMLYFSVCLASLSLFLCFVVYGGKRFRLPYLGMYLFLMLTLFLLVEDRLSRTQKWIALAVLGIPCILWHTFLFNVFLSDGWIFT
jgi:hypothetical protein